MPLRSAPSLPADHRLDHVPRGRGRDIRIRRALHPLSGRFGNVVGDRQGKLQVTGEGVPSIGQSLATVQARIEWALTSPADDPGSPRYATCPLGRKAVSARPA